MDIDDSDSDTNDDPGRRESELRLKHKMTSKYLDEVIHRTGMDYEEAVEAIERERLARDNTSDGTADMYSMDLRTDSIDWAARRNYELPYHAKSTSKSSESEPSKSEEYLKARQADRERVKNLLAAGKRISEGERAAVEGNGTASNAEEARAKEIFQAGLKGGGEARGVLQDMLKGARKMTNGLE